MALLLLAPAAGAMVGVAANPRASLLELIGPLERGFGATREQRRAVAEAIGDVTPAGMERRPLALALSL